MKQFNNKELVSLFGAKELDIDTKLAYQVQDIERIFEILNKNATNDESQRQKYVEEAIMSCFGVFQDDKFNPEQYAQGIKDYLDLSNLIDLWEEFRERFCVFLNLKVTPKTTIKKLISDIHTFSDIFFETFIISEQKKLAYKAGIWIACKSIERFDIKFCA